MRRTIVTTHFFKQPNTAATNTQQWHCQKRLEITLKHFGSICKTSFRHLAALRNCWIRKKGCSKFFPCIFPTFQK